MILEETWELKRGDIVHFDDRFVRILILTKFSPVGKDPYYRINNSFRPDGPPYSIVNRSFVKAIRGSSREG